MKNILCYGDSNTWGTNALMTCDEERRFPYDVRWPGALQNLLGDGYRIIEEGLGGRTVGFDTWPGNGRNGLRWLVPCIQTHQPIDLLVIMLGTNDLKPVFNAHPAEIARRMELLVKAAKNPDNYNCGVMPGILLVCPTHLGPDLEESPLYGIYNETSTEYSRMLGGYYQKLAERTGCAYLDAQDYAPIPPGGDSIHIDAQGQKALAKAIAGKIREIFA